MIPGDDLRAGLRLLLGLPRLLRRPLTHAESSRLLAERLGRREADFLRLVRSAVFDAPASPYRALLSRAGCTRNSRAAITPV